jgi:hypothetical protein
MDVNGVTTCLSCRFKVACWFGGPGNYDEAQNFCRSKGMELFVISSQAEYDALAAMSKSWFGSFNGGVIWVNGRQDGNGAWFTYNPNKVPLFSGAVPSNFYLGPFSCLVFDNFGGSFRTGIKSMCSSRISFYCEYFK